MTITLQQATDEAEYIAWYNNCDFAVWHGGHTVNFYRLDFENQGYVVPITSISVGDFSSGQITKESVKEGISTTFNKDFR